MIKLVVGLGNPGIEYENTRHNVGFMAIDNYIKNYNIDMKLEKKFKGYVGSFIKGDTKIYFLKPVTYMNLSGESVILLANFYKIKPENIMVIHDDLDLDIGYLRLREDGSSGGHNGIKNIILNLKTEKFNRVRVGIGKNKLYQTNDYVLGKFLPNEQEKIDLAISKIKEIIDCYILEDNYKKIMSKYNIKK